MREDRKGKAPLKSPREVNWERRMTKLEEEQARRGEESSREMLGVQKALKVLAESLAKSESERGKKRKSVPKKRDEDNKVPRRSSLELLEQAEDSEEEESLSEKEHY